MFENSTDIQPFLEDTELGLFAADIARLCKPSICFEAAEDRPGASRFGGLPDLAPGYVWPMREAYAHGLLVAERLAERGEGFASQFTVAAPLDFVCEIDLTDALLHKCEVSSWTMLLQVDMASLGTDFGEGTVYFVMREADLAKRDFSRVHAICRQT